MTTLEWIKHINTACPADASEEYRLGVAAGMLAQLSTTLRHSRLELEAHRARVEELNGLLDECLQDSLET